MNHRVNVATGRLLDACPLSWHSAPEGALVARFPNGVDFVAMKHFRCLKANQFAQARPVRTTYPARAISTGHAWLLEFTIVTLLSVAACNSSSGASPAASGGSDNTQSTNAGGAAYSGGTGAFATTSQTGGVVSVSMGGSFAAGGTSSPATTWQTGGTGEIPVASATGGQTANTSTTSSGTAGSSCVEHVHLASGKLGTNCASCHKAACNCYLSALDAELTCPQ